MLQFVFKGFYFKKNLKTAFFPALLAPLDLLTCSARSTRIITAVKVKVVELHQTTAMLFVKCKVVPVRDLMYSRKLNMILDEKKNNLLMGNRETKTSKLCKDTKQGDLFFGEEKQPYFM